MTSKTMTRLIASGIALLSSWGPAAAAANPDEGWRVGPRFGLSYATGYYGVEAQRGHVGIAGGVAMCPVFDGCLGTVALKYYVNETGNSWAFGVAYAEWAGDGDTSFKFDALVGLGAEYRWRFGSGWDLAVGLAYARGQGRDSYDDETLFLPTVSWGYSFSFR